MKCREKKGFTLAELLVVVAIIGVLVAVAIPVFGGSLEKAKLAADHATIRAAYAQIQYARLTGQVQVDGEYKTFVSGGIDGLNDTVNTTMYFVAKDGGLTADIKNAYVLQGDVGHNVNCETCAGLLDQEMYHAKGYSVIVTYGKYDRTVEWSLFYDV